MYKNIQGVSDLLSETFRKGREQHKDSDLPINLWSETCSLHNSGDTKHGKERTRIRVASMFITYKSKILREKEH